MENPSLPPESMSTEKRAICYQCEGVECKDLWCRLEGRQLIGYALPEGHTLQAAWELSVVFDSGLVLEFSSACTQTVDWQEVGSLNVRLTHRAAEPGVATTAKANELAVPPISLVAAEKLTYEDEDLVVECGLVLLGADDQQVVIAVGVPPGSVTVQASFSAGQSFEPQFQLSLCRRKRI
jgi:hypothetical protein